jgi:hypothetical protein
MSLLARALSLVGLLVALGSCSDEVVDRTVVTLWIQRSRSIDARMTTLRVRALRGGSKAEWQSMDYPAKAIRWPASIQLIPPDNANDKNGSFEISVAALQGETRLVEQRLLVVYRRHEQRLVSVVLEPCGAKPLGEVCSPDQNCTGATCQSCVDGACMERPTVNPDDPPSPVPDLDGGPLPDPVANDRDADAGDADAADADADVDAADLDASDADADADAGVDAGDADAGDAQPEPDFDASDAVDADASDAADASDLGVPDAGPPPAAECAVSEWTSARANSAVANNVFVGAMPTLDGVNVPQYVCRYDAGGGFFISGKVSGRAETRQYRDSCYYASFESGVWTSRPMGDVSGLEFQSLITKAGCTLAWADATAGQPLPAGALKTGNDGQSDLYTCRIDVSQTESVGKHIGRVSGAEPCRVQFFSTVLSSPSFQVLTQTASP